jgi:tetratricopeptide (TPR) repeat protein
MVAVAPLGRERELGQLLTAAGEAVGGRGAVVFLGGPTGSGKSFLLAALAAEVGAPAFAEADYVSVLCYETSAGNPLGPFGEVLRAITSQDRRGERAKSVLEVIGRVAPPLVELIPVIGKLASLGVKAVAEVGVYAIGGDHEGQQAQLAVDVAIALRSVADSRPLLVVIDDTHWIDAPSTEVIVRLAQGAAEHPLMLVVSYDSTLVDDRHPLARARAAVVGRPGVKDVPLPALSLDAIESILLVRYGTALDPMLAAWLLDLTEGSPLFVDQFLERLEAQAVIRREGEEWTLDGSVAGEPGSWLLDGGLARAKTPETLLEALRPRVADLTDEERALLEIGAVQGRRFLSSVLVRLLDQEEDDILDRLRRVAELRRMIASQEIEDWWSDHSALYSFAPGVLQELLYDRYAKSPYERRRRHLAVAQALETLIEEDDPPPRQAMLEIAHHYKEAGRPVEAAKRLVAVAESTFAEGADRETAAVAEDAVELLREALRKSPQSEAADAERLLARAILLQLLGREPSWHPEGGADARGQLLELAGEAEAAADACADARLKANARFAKALVLTAFSGLEEALVVYGEALELASAASDPLAEFAILVTFGHHANSRSLEEGSKLLRQARDLLDGGALGAQLTESQQASERSSLDATIGIAAFDLGRYGEALELLTPSPEALRAVHRREEAGWAHSFLAQVLLAIGSWEEAEASLRAGIERYAGPGDKPGLSGYLHGLLGRLHVQREPPRLEEARTELAAAREQSIGSGLRPVISLVDCYWAELLISEGTPEALKEAEQVLAGVCSFGWARSDITASSLRAEVALAEARLDDAVSLSTAAVANLEEHGGVVTAVRSEEILFRHARVLEAGGSPEAARYFAAAADVVRKKGESIPDGAQKGSFLGVRLSREILAAGPAHSRGG